MKRRLTILALTALVVVALISVVLTVPSPALADAALQISGIGYFAEKDDCDWIAQGADFALDLTGDLEGCLYVFVDTWECLPNGIYRETGTELFVGEGPEGTGTFRTTYVFTARYEDCSTLEDEIFGRCQHPIIAGSGTDAFVGVTGRIDFKDDIEEGDFPYRGHLRW